MITDTCMQKALNAFLAGDGVFEGLGLERLHTLYVWPKRGQFPNLDDFQFHGTNYEKNIRLKEVFADLWCDGDRVMLAHWIVNKWGGIRRNNDETIRGYVSRIEQEDFPSELSGVASYSKILAFIQPEKFAIYDARVAASLNGIQLLFGVDKGSIWNNLQGRNKKIEEFKKTLAGSQALERRGWRKLDKHKCYTFYNDELKSALSNFPDYKLFHLEMLLFATAEIIAERCWSSLGR